MLEKEQFSRRALGKKFFQSIAKPKAIDALYLGIGAFATLETVAADLTIGDLHKANDAAIAAVDISGTNAGVVGVFGTFAMAGEFLLSKSTPSELHSRRDLAPQLAKAIGVTAVISAVPPAVFSSAENVEMLIKGK